MKLGLVGTSNVSEIALRGAARVSGIAPTAVFSRKRETGESFAHKTGADLEIYTDFNKMTESGLIDCAYIASPNSLHYEQSRRFLEQGKHVLCEKPATVTPEQLRKLLRIAESNGLIYMEGMLPLYAGLIGEIHATVEDLGKVREAAFCFTQTSARYPAYLHGENPNIFNTGFATGALMDLGCYCAHMAILLFGAPIRVAAASAVKLENGCDCNGMAILEYPDKLVSLRYSKVGQGLAVSEIVGDNGVMTISRLNKLAEVMRYYPDGRSEELIRLRSHEDAFADEFREFYALTEDHRAQSKRYDDLKTQFLCAADTMYEIRRQADVSFPEETERL